MHGGKSRKGAGSATFKTGKYSKWLPVSDLDLIDLVVWRESNPDLQGMTQHIALLDMRLGELLLRAEDGAPSSWGDLKKACAAVSKARASGQAESMKRALERLGELIEPRSPDLDSALWDEIMETIRLRCLITAVELRRWVDARTMIPPEEVLGLMRALVEAVRRHVSDPKTLDAITSDFAAIIGRVSPSPRR
jgi:hypothetical protein